MRTVVAAGAVLVIACLAFAWHSDPLTLSVRPQVGLAPITWTIRVRVEPHEDNRGVIVAWYRDRAKMGQTAMTLDGINARAVPWPGGFQVRNVPVGTYEVIVEVKNGRGDILHMVKMTARVLSW